MLRRKTRACAAWIAAIPEPVRTAIAPYPPGDARAHGQWDMLGLVARFGAPALDLMHSTPALAFLLSASPVEQPARLLAQSQVDQLCALGFPARKSLVRLLRKIPPQHLDLQLLRALREHSNNEAVLRPLQHVATITASVLHLVLDDALRPRIAVSFLE